MSQGNQAMLLNSRIAIAILAISIALGGVTPARAQTATTGTSDFAQKSAADLLYTGKEEFQQGNYRRAISALNDAITQNPHDANIYYQRGLILYELGDELGALWDFDDALVRNPRHAQAYLHRAGLRLSLGLRSGAMQDLRIAAKLFSEQGNELGYQKTQNLIKHFNLDSP